MPEATTPILIGGGQFTQRTAREGRIAESLSPIAMMEKAARAALADTDNARAIASAIDTVSVVRFTVDSSDVGRAPSRNRGARSTRRSAATRRNGW